MRKDSSSTPDGRLQGTGQPRWFQIFGTLAVSCVAAAGVAGWLTMAWPDAGKAPDGIESARLAAELQELPRPFDEPDAAQELYHRKRIPSGAAVEPMALYRAAREHMLDLPRYSTSQEFLLPSRREMRGTHQAQHKVPAQLGTWEPLGPGNIGGRTRAFLIHPGKPRIRWAAGVSGGIWKTEDSGRQWRPLDDLMVNIAVNSLAMDPAVPDVIYAGTGEGHFREVVRGTDLPLRGAGIFKTVDGGESWSRLEATANDDFQWVNDLVVSPIHSRRLYAATRTGVWRSRDRGTTWMRVLDPEVVGGCYDLVIRSDRQHDDEVLAACGSFDQATIWRNTEAQRGRNNYGWTPVLTEEGMGRTSLAIAPSNQEVIYASASTYRPGETTGRTGRLHAIFRSDRGGEEGSWYATVRGDDPVLLNTLLLSNPVVAHYEICGFGEPRETYGFGWYTNVIAVDPVDPDIVWAGGIDLFRSDDGGRNWGLVTYYWDSGSAHADQHAVVFHPRYDGVANQTMFLTGDGGVWVTPNARADKGTGAGAACSPLRAEVRWASHNHNYGVTQFYHGAAFPDGGTYFAGAQDNGTVLGTDAAGVDGWERILGGDGGYVAVDPNDTDILYAEAQRLAFYKSNNGGRSFQEAMAGITESPGNFLFIVPFTMDPSNSRRLWIGGRRLWRTDNGAVSWTAASVPLATAAKVSAIAVAPTDSNRVVVGLSDGTIFSTDQALSAGGATVWESSRARDGGWVSSFAFHPEDADVVYATYTTFGGSHVFRSDLGGAAPWRRLDGVGNLRLPDLPVHSIVIDPTDPERLFIGTDLGVLVSITGGRRWLVENTGFAHAVTESL
ncbi:MAG: hypothetical protein GY856_01750, partial [bacterium]|nr:hypothetical protein [bacterium]